MTLKPQDVYALLKLVVSPANWTYIHLAAALGISVSESHACLKRATLAKLFDEHRSRPNTGALEEFLIHGVKYAFPAILGPVSRGVLSGFGAPVLAGHFEIDPSENIVWPAAEGNSRGVSIQPLYKSVPTACQLDQKLYKAMALVDAIRIGRSRERQLAQDMLIQLLRNK